MVGFILNIPYTALGFLIAVVSFPTSITFNTHPYAFVLRVKKFWWAFGYLRRARAMAVGHVVLLGPNLEEHDLEHELIHVEQHQRMPIIQPLLYNIELIRKGYRNNKYEVEAYTRAGNPYKGD